MFNNLVDKGKTIIIVTHDSAMAKRTHRTALIADGEIVNEYVAKAMPTLSHNELLQATKSAKALNFEPGAMILSEGTNADAFFIVSHGTVEVILPRPNQSDGDRASTRTRKSVPAKWNSLMRKTSRLHPCLRSLPVGVLAIGYDKLAELLEQSDVTREALKEMAGKHNGTSSWWGVSS